MASTFPVRQFQIRLVRRQAKLSSSPIRFQSSSTTRNQNPTYPLYPSVIQLLREKGIPESIISKIPATGPKGRLLKGDVLAYLGTVAADYPATQAARIAKMSHLDLSNIKLAPAPQRPTERVPVAEEAPRAETSVAVSISLASVLSVQEQIRKTLGITVPLSTFITRATDVANEDLPRSSLAHPTADELFDEILGASPVTTSRGSYVPEFNTMPAATSSSNPPRVREDIIDFLAGKIARKPPPSTSPTSMASALNVFSLTVPASDEKRAKVFLDRIRAILQVEPGRLVL
jgi:hypothetical protein